MQRITTLCVLGMIVALAFAGCKSGDDDDDSTSANAASPQATVLLGLMGRYNSGLFDADGGGAEITAFDPASDRAFVTNAIDQVVEVLDLSDPSSPSTATQVGESVPLRNSTHAEVSMRIMRYDPVASRPGRRPNPSRAAPLHQAARAARPPDDARRS